MVNRDFRNAMKAICAAALLLGSLGVLAANPAGATSGVTLSSSSGKVGQAISASGSGFHAGDSVGLYWNTTGSAPLSSVTVSGTGTFSQTVIVPASADGVNSVIADDPAASLQASAPFTVVPRLKLKPKAAGSGGTIIATLTGFNASQSVALTWQSRSGALLATAHTDTKGSGTTSFVVPQNPLGTYDVYATGSGGAPSAKRSFSLTAAGTPPTIQSFTVAPTSLPPIGGPVSFSWATTNASTCSVTSTPALAGLPTNLACSAGGGTASIPANAATAQASYTFTLAVTGALGPPSASAQAGPVTQPPLNWTLQYTYAASTLTGISCPSALLCVAVGSLNSNFAGLILRTVNGGAAWTAPAVPAGANQLSTVTCPTTAECLASTAEAPADVVKSTDGGASWSLVPLPTPSGAIYGLSCADANNCWVVGSSAIFASTDGGSTWVQQLSNPPAVLYGVSCPTTSRCWAVGGSAAGILTTSDGGATWTSQTVPTGAGDLFAVACPSATNCWALATSEIIATSDGQHWAAQYRPPGTIFSFEQASIACPTTSTCWAAGTPGGQAGGAELTTDGTNWSEISVRSASPGTQGIIGLGGIACPNPSQCWAVGMSSAGGPILTLGGGSATSSPPSQPLNVSAVAGHASATVSWSPPSSNGGSAITGYTVIPSPGCIGGCPGVTTPGSASSTVVGGLTNGTPYTFTVTASNSAGTGPPSAATGPVTPTAGASPPSAPLNVSAVARNASATVSWSPPSSNGGSAITGYTVIPSPACGSCTGLSATSTPTTAHGLTNGTPYTFTVTATNSAGTGPASSPSNSVIPGGPSVTTQPTDQTVGVGGTANFTAAPAGTPTPTVNWQVSTNGGVGWSLLNNGSQGDGSSVSGATADTMSISNAQNDESGFEYRAVFTNSVGSVTSNSATLTVTASDGSGSMTLVTIRPNQFILAGSIGNTVVLTYTAAGTMIDGAVGVTIPSGWSVPSGGPTDPGYTTASGGTGTDSVSFGGNTLAVRGVTLAGGQTLTVTYGSTAGGSIGATAAASTGTGTFITVEASTSSGTFTTLVASPSAIVSAYAPNAFSPSWSGYYTTGDVFTSVSGSWVVPTLSCSLGLLGTQSSVWVGIDGANGGATVEQIGTEQDCNSLGQANYYAWYEMFGTDVSGGKQVGITSAPVSPGDLMSASVSVSGTNWTLNIADANHWSSSTTIPSPSPTPTGSTAEWIVESPCIGVGQCVGTLPLSNFGTVTFLHTAAVGNGSPGGINSFTHAAEQLLSNGTKLADVSAPTGTEGDAFTVTWYHS